MINYNKFFMLVEKKRLGYLTKQGRDEAITIQKQIKKELPLLFTNDKYNFEGVN